MKKFPLFPLAAITVVVAASLACNLLSGRSDGAPTATPGPASNEDTAGETSSSVNSLEQVKDATVRITVEGSLVPPEVGGLVEYRRGGSGFIIDSSGLAVTNNHVVTGAGLVKVYVGEAAEARNARVLGVSECSDLAVIDIDGEDYSYLSWDEGSVSTGMRVYAAGFPFGQPQFTLTEGIVSRERMPGDQIGLPLTSVDFVIAHGAKINPGNSGGPLLSDKGRVIGVNYAGAEVSDENWAIGHQEAVRVIEQLRQDKDVHSIGVNGEAVRSEDGSIWGIWVYGVESGSPADEAGVTGGDILQYIEGVSVGDDGTMASYCDVLRSHSAEDTMSLEVLRFQTGEVLVGQLNGRPLETAGVFSEQLGGQVQDSTVGSYSEYVEISDDYGAIVVEVPAAWSHVDGQAWIDGGEVIGASIRAAPDLEGFLDTWQTPGMMFYASDDLATLGGYVQLLDIVTDYYRDACQLDGRYDYQDALYRGKYDFYVNCGGPGGAWYIVLTAVPIDRPQDFLILVEVQIISDADLDALDRILSTFQVVGVLP